MFFAGYNHFTACFRHIVAHHQCISHILRCNSSNFKSTFAVYDWNFLHFQHLFQHISIGRIIIMSHLFIFTLRIICFILFYFFFVVRLRCTCTFHSILHCIAINVWDAFCIKINVVVKDRFWNDCQIKWNKKYVHANDLSWKILPMNPITMDTFSFHRLNFICGFRR